MNSWMHYKQTKVSGTVCDAIVMQSEAEVLENRKYIKKIAKVAILCAKQQIALRGHCEGPQSSNRGNFLEILDLLKSENEWLEKRMESTPRNAKYTSPDIQNGILHAASRTVIEKIEEEACQAKYFAVMADESRDISKTEQVSLCIRYVINSNVYEKFLGFYDAQYVDAEALSTLIVKALQNHGLTIQNCIAQCYDGAAVMSGEHTGVQSRIKNIVDHCIFVHCHAHRLNLVLVSTARKIRSCDDFFGVLQLLHSFFSVSAKCHHQYIQTQKEHGDKPLEIPGLSDTRWACRFQCVRVVKMRIESVINALEDIRENSNDGIERAQVMGILAQVGCWDFIFHLCLFFKVLGIINGVSKALQSDSIDLAAAMNLVSATLRTLVDCRSDEEYQIIFDNTMKIATSLAIPTSRQSRRVRTQSTRLRDMVVLESTGDQC